MAHRYWTSVLPGDDPIVHGMLEAPDGTFLVHIWRLTLTSGR